jgi:hypothetical protein
MGFYVLTFVGIAVLIGFFIICFVPMIIHEVRREQIRSLKMRMIKAAITFPSSTQPQLDVHIGKQALEAAKSLVTEMWLVNMGSSSFERSGRARPSFRECRREAERMLAIAQRYCGTAIVHCADFRAVVLNAEQRGTDKHYSK